MKRIFDPIHGFIKISPEAIKIVDSKEFQRLRYIKQLGLAYLVYPGANHSRFEHSLGAYHLCKEILERNGIYGYPELELAALLHDIGHGPFSHLIEEIPEAKWTHEEEGRKIVLESSLKDLISDLGASPKRVSELICGNGKYGSLISGDVDVDRMDYIARDAHYTGVGITLDLERLLETIILRDGGVMISSGGMIPAEEFLISRFFMYPKVYLHHTVRSAELMMRNAIRNYLQEGGNVQELVRLDDTHFLSKFLALKGISGDLVRDIYWRRLFKRAYEARRDEIREDVLREIEKNYSTIYKIEEEIAEELGVKRELVCIDVPEPHMTKAIRVMIYEPREGRVVNLDEISTVAQTLYVAQYDYWKLRVYVPKGIVEDARRISSRILSKRMG